jgi:predicted PolB exonuclease-like 3'-5' exonuclease
MGAANRLIHDIEAVPCEVAGPPRRPPTDDRLPPPAHWRIVAIGYVWLDDHLMTQRIGGVGGPDARATVSKFMAGIWKRRPLLIGSNIRGFDQPCILKACFEFGLPYPFEYRGGELFYRYSTARVFDTQEVLSGFGAGKPSSVDAWAKLAGFPGKVGMDGSQVEALIAAGDYDAVCKYGTSDACQETAIYLRTELVRGLPLDHYRAAGESLLKAIEADPAVAPMAAMVDRERFLLTGAHAPIVEEAAA